VHGFAGRRDALMALDGWLPYGRSGHTPAAVLVITGTPGVGKSTLAVQWAHQVADRFPDGQLYANLRGYHPSGHAVTPEEAVRGFLDAFGVSPNRIPSDLDAQTALYRSLISGKRMLVLLDNARDAEQVRHLLPGSNGCVTVITSRNQLTGLVAAVAARQLTLDLLSANESRQLLAARLGADRVGNDPESADEIGARCARLPLALAVVAALAATREDASLRALTAELRESRSGLDAFSTGDPTTDARAVFSWSYGTLSLPAARLFRLLGLHPGPDVSTSAAASLVALPPARVRPLLAELCRAHLLTANVAGRYAFHDLLRAYAAELATDQDSDSDRRSALRRLLDHLVHSGHAAAMQLSPDRKPFVLMRPEPGVTVDVLGHYEHAMAWFTAERETLLAAVETAERHGLDQHVWQISATMSSFLFRKGYWRDWRATQQVALEAARRVDDTGAQAMAHVCLGTVQQFIGQDSHIHLERALELYDKLGDPAGKAYVHWLLSRHYERNSRAEALHHAERALAFARDAGDTYAEARALNAVGWEHLHLGNHDQGIANCKHALVLNQQVGNRLGEANTWDSLALAHHQAGNHAEAITCYESALRLFRDLEVHHTEADTLRRLGDTHVAVGDHDAARAAWQQALTILDRLDHPHAGQVQTLLDDLAPTGRESAPDVRSGTDG
jgi:tetratricopeptide (TPR) repeat protein